MTDTYTLGFVCVQNAGRSQMATAFAERERTRRGLEEAVEIVTGGTHPAESVHDVVVRVMNGTDTGIDLSDRTPRKVPSEELGACDVVATMGCSTLELDADADVDVRDWALDDPDGADLDEARRIRDTVQKRVEDLFDEVEADLGHR
ncbi:low molecular weight phosphatase family protein [Natronomonas sp. LN261]|jgi:arsenate reductase|uniref:arsenate-mycothiol transferase ArsC n=1 Tax=Natronomonas sp. LN261 TaxID=2750669 RepID=UPI0015EF37B4|nr:low molecular weight phosphatase family protein [Natronomonas sp. LN261]